VTPGGGTPAAGGHGKLHCRVSGEPVVPLRLLGGGSQGEVWLAKCEGQEVALKWYRSAFATALQHSNLEKLARRTPPSPSFMWPRDLVLDGHSTGFGYVMPLVPKEFRKLPTLLDRDELRYRKLFTMGLNLAESFSHLHAGGLYYGDINWGAIFVRPEDGAVRIVDNDNVITDGSKYALIGGTPGFAAPELVLHQHLPSTKSDLHSLAVLLFYSLFKHHPLEGRRMLDPRLAAKTVEVCDEIYGKDPRFIFDPKDASNAAMSVEEAGTDLAGAPALYYWNHFYPKALKRLFVRAFTDGLRNPDARVTEAEWQSAMVQLRDLLVNCSVGHENLIDPAAHAPGAGTPRVCYPGRCEAKVAVPFLLELKGPLGTEYVVLNRNTRLFRYHLERARPLDFSTPLAEMAQKPGTSTWGLRNLSPVEWHASTVGSAPTPIPHGRAVPLAAGLRLQMGDIAGTVT
jgi:eukaryotic-like serine/threonine-protein kinase